MPPTSMPLTQTAVRAAAIGWMDRDSHTPDQIAPLWPIGCSLAERLLVWPRSSLPLRRQAMYTRQARDASPAVSNMHKNAGRNFTGPFQAGLPPTFLAVQARPPATWPPSPGGSAAGLELGIRILRQLELSLEPPDRLHPAHLLSRYKFSSPWRGTAASL